MEEVILLNALYEVGLVSLIHIPSPMNFLTKILGRSDNERAYSTIPFGFPSSDCEAPNISRKLLDEIRKEY